MLNILSGYDLPKLGPDRSPRADPHHRRSLPPRLPRPQRLPRRLDFNTLPLKQMADPAYAAAWRKSIDPEKPTPSKDLVRPAGFMPPPPDMTPGKPEGTQTTHFSIVDKDGNAVSSTYTLNGFFGNGAAVDGLGFVMNNEMDDFTSKVGVRNGYGLIQGPANAIAPGKRPLSSMTPTMLTKNGKLFMVLGSPGGSTIITTVANDIISVIDNGLNVQQAADAPRFHHQDLPDILQFEKKFDLDVVQKMSTMGYATTATPWPTPKPPASGATARSSPSTPRLTNFWAATTPASTTARPTATEATALPEALRLRQRYTNPHRKGPQPCFWRSPNPSPCCSASCRSTPSSTRRSWFPTPASYSSPTPPRAPE